MAKRKRKPAPANHMDVAMRLPIPVLRFSSEVAKLAGVTVNDVLNVMIATEVVRRGYLQSSEEG